MARRNTFGSQIRELRLARGISTADMAARLGAMGWDVSSSTYAHIEGGRRIISDTELLMMLRVLRVELGDLKVPKAPRQA